VFDNGLKMNCILIILYVIMIWRGVAAIKTNLTTKTQRTQKDLCSFLCTLCAFVVHKNFPKKEVFRR